MLVASCACYIFNVLVVYYTLLFGNTMEYKKPPQEEQVVLGGLHVAGLLGCWVAGWAATDTKQFLTLCIGVNQTF